MSPIARKLQGAFFVSLLSLVFACAGIAKDRPNVIFILADDWGLGDVKTYGGERCQIETPHMDRLAEDGMKFTDAHSSSSVCTPTRYSVLTGRYNWRSELKRGVLYGYSEALIEPERSTVASLLGENGYDTACIGKWHLGMGFPTTDGKPANSTAKTAEELATKCNVDWGGKIENGPNSVGFDYYYGISASLDMHPYIWIENDRFVGECTEIKAFHRPGPAEKDFEDYDVLPTLTRKAVDYISAPERQEQPFFLYMALNSPHTPISPSEPFRGKSKLGVYGDFVMETDWSIGQVVDAVDRAGLGEDTLIIVTADNGCSNQAQWASEEGDIKFFEGEASSFEVDVHYPSDIYRGHKADIYEGGHRVPYLARWSGKVAAGSVCEQFVCLVDLFATCADIIDVDYAESEGVDSVSVLPLLHGKTFAPTREAVVHHSIRGNFAIRKDKWKLCFGPGSGGWTYPTLADLKKMDVENWIQLFDLESDPTETNNVAGEHPELVKELTEMMQGYIEEGRSTPGAVQENNGETPLYPAWIQKAGGV